jgi:hypothetical protein
MTYAIADAPRVTPVIVAKPGDRYAGPLSRLPATDEVVLWRYSAQWNAIAARGAREFALDEDEESVRSHPNRAFAKQYVMACAAVRRLLVSMVGLPRADVRLKSLLDTEVVVPQAPDLVMQVRLSGVYILVAAARFPIGLAASLPTGTRSGPAVASSHEAEHDTARTRSLRCLLGRDVTGPHIAERDPPSLLHVTHGPDEPLHILDIPMPGRIAAAAAFPLATRTVTAIGWNRRHFDCIALTGTVARCREQ